jgi:hypothetical protein
MCNGIVEVARGDGMMMEATAGRGKKGEADIGLGLRVGRRRSAKTSPDTCQHVHEPTMS